MPQKFLPISFAPDDNACSLVGTDNASGVLMFANRGGCSFLDKATNASSVDASALVIVNNDTNLFHIAAGYATGSDFVEDSNVPSDLPMVSSKVAAEICFGKIENTNVTNCSASLNSPLCCNHL